MSQSTTNKLPNIDAYLDTASAMLELSIDETSRPGVTQFLCIAAQMAEVLDEVELGDAGLPWMPVFRAPDATPR